MSGQLSWISKRIGRIKRWAVGGPTHNCPGKGKVRRAIVDSAAGELHCYRRAILINDLVRTSNDDRRLIGIGSCTVVLLHLIRSKGAAIESYQMQLARPHPLRMLN